MFGSLRKEVGEAISKVYKMEGVTIIKAATLPDHVCLNTTEDERVKSSRKDQRKEQSDAIRQASGI